MEKYTHLLEVSADMAARLRTAYETDIDNNSDYPMPFNDWLLSIVLDWVKEVEKPITTRDL